MADIALGRVSYQCFQSPDQNEAPVSSGSESFSVKEQRDVHCSSAGKIFAQLYGETRLRSGPSGPSLGLFYHILRRKESAPPPKRGGAAKESTQGVQYGQIKALIRPLAQQLRHFFQCGKGGHGAHPGDRDGSGVAGKGQGLRLGKANGQPDA